MSTLRETFKETTIRMLQTYIQHYIDHHCQRVWDGNLPEIQRIFAQNGDSAYGFFCRKLFEPLVAEIVESGFHPRPLLPGAFPQSVEQWGPWEDRERRFWSVIYGQNEQPLGTLVTSIFHDHTSPRLPRRPQVVQIRETDPIRISDAIVRADLKNENEGEGGATSYE
ncbi:DUF6022 family protein [Paenibacillus aurantiacus]|uniref:DUF6022 family protein n=1 Tax=Paenibacillus aurantiacus TaxID=1936118 RepID=A0ABV5KJY8_9BACL